MKDAPRQAGADGPDRPSAAEHLTHVNEAGEVHMVDVSSKANTLRRAVAKAEVHLMKETASRIASGELAKGDVLATARIAGIQAAKRTWELIPLCHQVALTRVTIDIQPRLDRPSADFHDGERAVLEITATAEANDRTGVEMEALVAVSTAALTIYDMVKAVDRWITIQEVGLIEKSGGKSGLVRRGGT